MIIRLRQCTCIYPDHSCSTCAAVPCLQARLRSVGAHAERCAVLEIRMLREPRRHPPADRHRYMAICAEANATDLTSMSFVAGCACAMRTRSRQTEMSQY